MPVVGYDSTRPRNNRAGNAFAVRRVKLMGKCDHWWNGDGVERSTPRRISVVQCGGDTLFVLHSPIDKSAEVRTSQTLWNRIKSSDVGHVAWHCPCSGWDATEPTRLYG